jgi:aryl-alcohol dehydrogenase-like predicted oxidoreductase
MIMNHSIFLSPHQQTDPFFNRLTLGVAGLGGVWADVQEDESVDAILFALGEGVKAVDVAPSYNNGELYLGKALKKWRGERPFISTKIGRLKAARSDIDLFDYSPTSLKTSFYKSLDLLGVDKVDVLLLHDVKNMKEEEIEPAIEVMQRLKSEGLCSSIGIGGNYRKEFEPFVKGNEFSIFMGYNRLNACNVEGLNAEVAHVKSEQMQLWAASPLNMGLLGSRFSEFKASRPYWITDVALAKASKLNEIAERIDTSLSSLSMRFLRAMTVVDKVVVGPSNLKETKSCINIWREEPLPKNILDEVLLLHK